MKNLNIVSILYQIKKNVSLRGGRVSGDPLRPSFYYLLIILDMIISILGALLLPWGTGNGAGYFHSTSRSKNGKLVLALPSIQFS